MSRITVSFSIADLAFDQDLAEEDEAFDDEELDTDSLQNPNQQRGVSAQGGSRSAPAEEAIEEDEEEGDMDGEVVPPVRLSIVVEKPGKGSGALSIEATAQDGEISVDNVHYYPEAKQAFASSAEASHGRAQVYPGPPFGTLEEDLQVLVEQYLEERGVTPALAVFAPEYVNWKEQQEYVAWLKNVKSFVDL
jgi:complement component 1 Q subcomponent-binding protein